MRRNGMSLLQSFAEGPSLICPQHLSSLRNLIDQPHTGLIASIARKIGIGGAEEVSDTAVNNDQLCESFGFSSGSDRSKPFAFSAGLAFIPVWGTLLHRDNWCDSYATGYDYIRRTHAAAVADPDVRGIVFDVNSGGGMVSGNFELCEDIYNARSVKPSLALIDANCYSGGYSIGSSAGRMVATPSGGVGSIGVVMMHASIQDLIEKHGVKINFIHAGAHKVDGNMYQDLPAEVRARYQASVEKSYDKFVTLVARNRGIEADAVRATEALCYDADEALSLGLIDAVQTPLEALTAFLMELDGSDTNPKKGATNMSTNATATGGDGKTVTTETTTTATVVATADIAAPNDTQAERDRCAGIVGCEEAKGREALASHFAFKSTMSVEDARAALAAAPATTVIAAPAANTAFAAAMAGTPNPEVGAAVGDAPAEVKVGDRLAANYAAMTGFPMRSTK